MKAARSCSHGYSPLIKTTHSHHSCVFLCGVLVHHCPLREIRVALTELSPAQAWLTFSFLFCSFCSLSASLLAEQRNRSGVGGGGGGGGDNQQKQNKTQLKNANNNPKRKHTKPKPKQKQTWTTTITHTHWGVRGRGRITNESPGSFPCSTALRLRNGTFYWPYCMYVYPEAKGQAQASLALCWLHSVALQS